MLMFSRRLQAARKAVGFIDQAEFANAISVSPRRYAQFEAGRLMPNPDELAAISKITNHSVDWLVTGMQWKAAA